MVEPVTVPELAVIVVAPTLFPVARPPEAMVATDDEEELQFTMPVRFCVLPSV